MTEVKAHSKVIEIPLEDLIGPVQDDKVHLWLPRCPNVYHCGKPRTATDKGTTLVVGQYPKNVCPECMRVSEWLRKANLIK